MKIRFRMTRNSSLKSKRQTYSMILYYLRNQNRSKVKRNELIVLIIKNKKKNLIMIRWMVRITINCQRNRNMRFCSSFINNTKMIQSISLKTNENCQKENLKICLDRKVKNRKKMIWTMNECKLKEKSSFLKNLFLKDKKRQKMKSLSMMKHLLLLRMSLDISMMMKRKMLPKDLW